MRRRFFLSMALAVAAGNRSPLIGQPRSRGRLLREWWFEPGVENGNPMPNRRFRVNSPEVVLHQTFGSRDEVKGNGMMLILAQQDLRQSLGAELYLELWGGHPHTANKRVTLNGRSTYALPSALTASGHCTHAYPTIPLRRTDLVNGFNALQFACDQGSSFWGHFIVENACLRTEVPHALDIGLRGVPDGAGAIRFELTGADAAKASGLEVETWYEGFPENGAATQPHWHGFTKNRQPVAIAGAHWDTRMLPRQTARARAWMRLEDVPGARFVTAECETPPIGSESLSLHYADTLPAPFWSRANRKQSLEIGLPGEPGTVKRAELHVVTWDGGRGNVQDYFTLNETPLAVCGEARHDVIYSRIELPPSSLRSQNRVELLSDTEHHGIEILWPGPCLAVQR